MRLSTRIVVSAFIALIIVAVAFITADRLILERTQNNFSQLVHKGHVQFWLKSVAVKHLEMSREIPAISRDVTALAALKTGMLDELNNALTPTFNRLSAKLIISSLRIYGANGNSLLMLPASSLDYTKTTMINSVIKKGTIVSGIVTDRRGQYEAYIAFPLYRGRGKLLAIAVFATRLESTIVQFSRDVQVESFLLDMSNNLNYATNPGFFSQLTAQVVANTTSLPNKISSNDGAYYLSSIAVNDFDHTSVARLVLAEEYTAIEKEQGFIEIVSVVSFVLIIVFSGLILWFYLRHNLRPLEIMRQDFENLATKTIGGENLHDYTERNDEIGSLSRAAVVFRDTLHDTVAQKKDLEQQAEELVSAMNKLAEAEIELKFLANHDVLTGLPSSRLCQDRIGQALTIAKRKKTQLALMFIDLDGFKKVNDTLGHEAGNLVLQSVAERLKSVTREMDTVGRIGGDEFSVLMPQLEDRKDVEIIASRIVDTLSQPFIVGKDSISIGSSIGIAIFPEDGDSSDILMRVSDEAMYKVKKQGKNNYGFA